MVRNGCLSRSEPHCPPMLPFPQEKAPGLTAVILGPVKGWEEQPPSCRTDCGSTLVLNEQVQFAEMLS